MVNRHILVHSRHIEGNILRQTFLNWGKDYVLRFGLDYKSNSSYLNQLHRDPNSDSGNNFLFTDSYTGTDPQKTKKITEKRVMRFQFDDSGQILKNYTSIISDDIIQPSGPEYERKVLLELIRMELDQDRVTVE